MAALPQTADIDLSKSSGKYLDRVRRNQIVFVSTSVLRRALLPAQCPSEYTWQRVLVARHGLSKDASLIRGCSDCFFYVCRH